MVKHGVSNVEAESIFNDPYKLIRISNRSKEIRYLCTGRGIGGRILTNYFILRDAKVRIIGSRVARKEERERYLERKNLLCETHP